MARKRPQKKQRTPRAKAKPKRVARTVPKKKRTKRSTPRTKKGSGNKKVKRTRKRRAKRIAKPKVAAGDVECELREHALAFHRVLSERRIYTSTVSDETFLAQTKSTLDDEATSVRTGRTSKDLALLALPVSLLHGIRDWVPTMAWDYEFGYEALFEDLGPMFEKAGSTFEWTHVDGAGADRYEYTLDGQRLTLEPRDDVEVHPLDYNQIVADIDRALAPMGKKLYDPVTGDQSGRLLVIPIDSEPALAEVLVGGRDPRADQFY